MGTSQDHGRVCGPCTACCTVIAVPELEKGHHEACAHLCGSGCGIHPWRPESCRSFECQWLRGVLEVDGAVDTALRPDACGVIFDYHPDSAFGEVYTAWEVEPGASTSGAAAEVLRDLSGVFLVLVLTHGAGGLERRFVGPGSRVQQAEDVAWSRGREGRRS